MKRRVALLIVVGLVAPTFAQDKPKEPSAEAKPAKKARANIYDEKADGQVLIAAACGKAAKENRRVLIQWGGNWCGWCHLLHDVFTKNPEVARLIRYEYDLVLLDTSVLERDPALKRKYGEAMKGRGVPFLTMLAADGSVLAERSTEIFETPKEKANGNSYEIPKLVEFLKAHVAPPLAAKDVLAAARTKAKGESKAVFLHFGAPWCGWCHQLEAWMAQPTVAALLARDFVEVKVDTDRMTGGKELLAEYCKEEGGIPWFCFLDGEGKNLADSGAGRKNIGFPSTDEEIGRFAALVSKAKRNLTDSDMAALTASLKAWREKTRPRSAAAN